MVTGRLLFGWLLVSPSLIHIQRSNILSQFWKEKLLGTETKKPNKRGPMEYINQSLSHLVAFLLRPCARAWIVFPRVHVLCFNQYKCVHWYPHFILFLKIILTGFNFIQDFYFEKKENISHFSILTKNSYFIVILTLLIALKWIIIYSLYSELQYLCGNSFTNKYFFFSN